MANQLNAYGITIDAQAPSDITSNLSGSADKVLLYASGSGADTRLYVKAGANSQTLLGTDIDKLDALGGTGLHQTQDHFLFSDNGTEKKITFSNLQDAIFADISGDATVAAGGALTIANDAVEQAMIADDAVGADQLAASAVVNASVVDGTLKADKLDIDGSTDIGADLVDADLMVVDDGAGGTNRKSALSRVKKYIYSAMSGDATASDAGALTIASDAVEPSMINVLDDSLAATDTHFLIADGTDYSSFALSGDVTCTNAGVVTIANDAVEQAMIADDAVGADQLASNAVVNASVASNAAIAATKIDFNVDLGGDVTFGTQSDDTISTTGHLTVGGNLTVQGTTTTVDSTTVNVSSSFTFEGPADDHETILHAGTPSQDITVYLPQYSSSAGAHSAYLAVLADAPTQASQAVTAAEFALLDGGTARGTTALASGDGFLHNDAGTMRMTSIDKLADFFAGSGLDASSGVMELDIDGLSALGGASMAQADLLVIDDGANGTNKKVTFSNLEDSIFGNVSGDATIAAGGALTIAAGAVENSMLADDAVGADELAANAVVNASIASNAAIDMDKLDGGSLASSLSDLAQGDLLYAGDVDDSNNLKSITFSNLEDAIFGNVSGDATIAAGGALTIADSSVENDMLAGSIANAKLANSAVTVGTTSISLGDSSTTIAGLTSLDCSAADQTIYGSLAANTGTIGHANSTIAVPGQFGAAGGYGAAGVSINQAGSLLMNGNLQVDGDADFAAAGGYSVGGSGLTITTAGGINMNGDLVVESNGAGSADVTFHGASTDKNFMWDASADTAVVNGSLTVNGVTTLEGNVAVDGNVTLESDHDVKARGFITYSDRELKTNIQPMNNALEKVMKLEAVSYDLKAGKKNEVGFIAQDVAKVAPEICAIDRNGIGRGIDYSRMSTLLVGALKAQQGQIEELKGIIAKLQK